MFIDVEKLEAGKFDNNLLTSVRNAHNFVIVLSEGALDRCKGDSEMKDWVHRVSDIYSRDNNLLTSVRNAHHFVIVLSEGALDRFKGDSEMKDWVHSVSDNY